MTRMEFRVKCANCPTHMRASEIADHRTVPEGQGYRDEFYCGPCAARLAEVLAEVTT